MKIDTFSFRFADTQGFMEWYRYNPQQGLWIDKFDGMMQAKRCEMTEEEKKALLVCSLSASPPLLCLLALQECRVR